MSWPAVLAGSRPPWGSDGTDDDRGDPMHLLSAAKRAAVRHVKPRVEPATWTWLRGPRRQPRPAPAPVQPPVRPPATRRRPGLTELAQQTGTDKWGAHFYTPHYEQHLAHLRDEAFVLLEIGVGGYDRAGRGGASLRMWRRYFPSAQVVGLDIEDKSFLDRPRLATVQGDQTDPEVLTSILTRFGTPLVVIDDGSHRPADVLATFAQLFPRLPDGALYFIEDTQTSYWPEWGGQEDPRADGTTMAFVKDLVDGLNHEEFVRERQATYTDVHVRAVHCWHNLVLIEKGDNREGTNKREVLRERYASAPVD